MELKELDKIQNNFNILEESGRNGTALVNITKSAIQQMEMSVAIFESGMQSEEWSMNFQMFASEEGAKYSYKVLEVFKKTLMELKNI